MSGDRILIFAARIRRMGKVIFSVCLSVHTRRGAPSPSYDTSTGPMSFKGGTPVTGPSSLPRGYPTPGGGYPSWVPPSRDGVPPGQVRMAVSGMEYPSPGMGYPLARSVWGTWDGYPHPGMAYPLARSGWGVPRMGYPPGQG